MARVRPARDAVSAALVRARPPEGLLEAAGAISTYSRVYQLSGEDLTSQLEKQEKKGRLDRARTPPLPGEKPPHERPRLSLDDLYRFEAEWDEPDPGATEVLRDLQLRQWHHGRAPPPSAGVPPPAALWRPTEVPLEAPSSRRRAESRSPSRSPSRRPSRSPTPLPEPRSHTGSRSASPQVGRLLRQGLGQGLGEDAQHSDSRGSLCSLAPSVAPSVAPSLAPSLAPSVAPSVAPRRPAVNRGRLWLRHEAAGAAADAAEAAGSAEAAERAVAAHLYSLRISRSVMTLVESELEAAGQRLHPYASQRLEAAVGAEAQAQLARLLGDAQLLSSATPTPSHAQPHVDSGEEAESGEEGEEAADQAAEAEEEAECGRGAAARAGAAVRVRLRARSGVGPSARRRRRGGGECYEGGDPRSKAEVRRRLLELASEPTLQPHASHPATLCAPPCNPMCPTLQP